MFGIIERNYKELGEIRTWKNLKKKLEDNCYSQGEQWHLN